MNNTLELNVKIMTDAMRFSKNGKHVVVSTKDGKHYSGLISKFDGRNVVLSGDVTKSFTMDDIENLEAVEINWNMFLNKRILINTLDGATIDGVLVGTGANEIQLITESGIESFSVCRAKEARELYTDIEKASEGDEPKESLEFPNEQKTEKGFVSSLLNVMNKERNRMEADDEGTAWDSGEFRTALQNPYFDFEKEIKKNFSISIIGIEECLCFFKDMNYEQALSSFVKCKNESGGMQQYTQIETYLKEVLARFREEKKNLVLMDTNLSKGIIASKIEKNPDKAYFFLKKALTEETDRLNTVVYRILIAYWSSGNYERAAEVATTLFEATKTIRPKYNQKFCWKTMITIFKVTEQWENYLEALDGFLISVDEHPLMCFNMIMKGVKPIENIMGEEKIRPFYLRAVQTGINPYHVALRLANYMLMFQEEDIEDAIQEYLLNDEIKSCWKRVKEENLLALKKSSDRYAYIEDAVRAEEKKIQKEKEIKTEIQKETKDAFEQETDNITIEKEIEEKENLEKEFRKFRDQHNAAGAKSYFNAQLKKHEEVTLYRELNLRAELYFSQNSAYKKNKGSLSERYRDAMSLWLKDRKLAQAEERFMDDIMADSLSRGTTILSYIDMIAVENGIRQAMAILLDLQPEIKFSERNEKIAFYEKKYMFSITIDDIAHAFDALNVLKGMYYNKTKLGNTWYRTAECRYKQGKWKAAVESYTTAMEYNYLRSICQKKILHCKKNMGETIEGTLIDEIPTEIRESNEKIRAKLESYYNKMRYHEANIYIKDLLKSFPDDEELIEIAKETEAIVQRFTNYAVPIPTREDSQAIAWRAWHIENDFKKAKKYFKKGIEGNEPKQMSCIMDLSEMLMHTEGPETAIACLIEYQPLVAKLKAPDQSGFYEKMYLMHQKTKNVNAMLEDLDRLANIYGQAKRPEKVAFSYYRSAIACFQDKRYEDAISRMETALSCGYRGNVCYKCIAISYANMGRYTEAEEFLVSKENQKDTIADSSLINTIYELKEQIQTMREKADNLKEDDMGDGMDEDFENELNSEFMLGFNNKFEAFFVENYRSNPIGIALEKIEQNSFVGADIARLEREGWQHKLRERTGFFGTAAYMENQLNGNSTKYYELLRNSTNSWGLELQSNGNFNCACACFVFSHENDLRVGKGGERSVVNYLTCILKKRLYSMPDKDDEIRSSVPRFIAQVMEFEGAEESILKELILLIEKSPFIKDILKETSEENKKIWMEQFTNFLGSDEEIDDMDAIFNVIKKRYWEGENALLNFTNKVKNSRVFNDEMLTEIREFKKILFVFDADVQYLEKLINAYEKGIEIYDYADYDNRMATIGNVQSQIRQIGDSLRVAPTYFGINFLQEIIDALLVILSELSKKTTEELQPELSVVVPIVDVPVVDGYQGISVTISNKDNSASAKDVRLSVIDVAGNVLVEPFLFAQYLKGGKSTSKEFRIPSQGGTYTIKLLLSYHDHEDSGCRAEQAVSISTGTEEFKQIKSPYFTGDSIDVSQHSIFVGRDILLDSLENALCNNKSGCEIIYGQKRCGKSSIANFLEDRLKNQFFIIKFSIGAARSTRTIYINIKDLIVEKVEDLLDMPQGNAIFTEDVLDIIEKKPVGDDEEFVSFIRLVHRKICKPMKREILLMIDEFTHLYRYVKENRRQVAAFMDTWKKLLEADLFKAVLIGQDTMPNFIKEFQNQFQVTQPIRVDRLDDDSVRTLISTPILMENGESRFLENSIDLIAGWFYGQPYYIQLYCDRLVKQMNIEQHVRVTNALAEKVKEIMLEEADEDMFDNLISKGDESGTEGECYEILKKIASLTKNSEWADINDITVKNRDELVNDLINRSVIKKMNNKCKILISFFKEWLNLN